LRSESLSRRTADADKAIRKAWVRGQQLVLQGKGTRDWTEEQQRSILDKGKAYDKNGKAFQGRHMKSVSAFPELQGETGNIEFLTAEEHKEAHDGDFRKPTNQYFEPITKKSFPIDVKAGPPVLLLSNPAFHEIEAEEYDEEFLTDR